MEEIQQSSFNSVIVIRKASASEANAVADCLFLAMEEIVYLFMGERNAVRAKAFLKHLVAIPLNQYSYQNCWVAVVNNNIIGAANVYNGADLHFLRQPVLALIETNFGRKVLPENETGAGEYYLDSFGVLPDYQGKGIGALLLQFLIHEYVIKKHCPLGLLVDEGNPKAKRLYLKLGFQPIAQKQLLGKTMEHLQIFPQNSSHISS